MGAVASKLTVLFEDPFWVGLYERSYSGRYEVCKITFGAEPKDCEVYNFMLQNWHRLRFSLPIRAEVPEELHVSPKRRQRQAGRELEAKGIGTKAQQALKLQQAEGLQARKKRSREQREAEAARQFGIRQEKHREKHRGH